MLKTLLLCTVALTALAACGPSPDAPKIAPEARKDLEKAKGVESTVLQQDDAARKQIDDASK
ncbi:hypothetical protein [Silvimonas iriomotensis]|uniref:Lipoprotein n=1 Tax=Silvimonas iriomotensis TaxID=449662 RepID=A0ABQ2P7S7_9NEIS|nr:hypothetical protein [Silvimonas iriomotensis]GGP20327.1 hypothetical protein GCM10010970_14670 [Silvimonas iriomotensis]